MKGRYRRYKGWCRCDRAIVEEGKKCPVCGYVEKRKMPRIKKQLLLNSYYNGE